MKKKEIYLQFEKMFQYQDIDMESEMDDDDWDELREALYKDFIISFPEYEDFFNEFADAYIEDCKQGVINNERDYVIEHFVDDWKNATEDYEDYKHMVEDESHYW